MPGSPIHSIAQVDKDLLHAIYRDRDDLPRGWCGRPDPERLVAHASAQAARILDAPRASGFATGQPGAGVSAYLPRAWDSEILGLRVGSVPLLEMDARSGADPSRSGPMASALAAAALEAARADGAAYVTARLDNNRGAGLRALEACGFRIVDGVLHFGIDLDDMGDEVPGAPGVRDAREDDIPALRRLAATAFRYDRFHRDPVIASEAADALHANWVENGVRGATGCAVLVAEVEGSPAGFFVLSEDPVARETLGFGVGALDLIGIDPARQRRGIGAALSWASLDRLRARGNRFAEVGTQTANLPASNLYARCGFQLVASSLTLRWWQGDAAGGPA